MNNNISCGIKTFLRETKLQACLHALVGKGFQEVIVADDGPISAAKREIYETYSSLLPLHLIVLPFDTGISAGRNAIVDRCTTEYLLILDDDQIIPDNIEDLYLIMKQDVSLGGISGYWNEYGKLRCGATDLYFTGRYLVKDIRDPSPRMYCDHLSYYAYDFIPNSTLFRRNCLQDVIWDPFYKIGSEHLDFYLAHKKLGKWKFAVTPDVMIIHDPREPETAYRENFRKNEDRLQVSLDYLNSKWGIADIIENRKHISDPGVSAPRQALISHLIRFGMRPDRAIGLVKKMPGWLFKKYV